MDVPDDIIQASAVQYLIDGGEEDAASVLLSCSLEIRETGQTWWSGAECLEEVRITLSGPRASYDIMMQPGSIIKERIRQAIESVMPPLRYLGGVQPCVSLVDIGPGWREDLLMIARGKGVTNQGVGTVASNTWCGLRFRSASEMRIAQALDRAGVFFLPNCRGRVNGGNARKNIEPDFHVCDTGRCGIIEVDGESFHPATRAVHDHERDRLFHAHGIMLVQHYDSTRCYRDPDGVVTEFLTLLRQQA